MSNTTHDMDAQSARPGGVRPGRRPTGVRRRYDAVTGIIFVAPMAVLFLIFRLVPSIGAAGMSFTNYQLSGDFNWIGFKNYATFFTSPIARNALATTLLYAAIYVPMILVAAIVTALVLHRIAWGSGFFRSALFLPYVTSFVLAGIIWKWIFDATGPINSMIARFGGAEVPFLTGDKLIVLSSLAVVSVWRGFGYSMLILLAGLKSIPTEINEAATLDGIGPFQRFFRITLPLLRPAVFFVLVIETIGAFQVFDTIYVMTGGGPARASYALVMYLYDASFTNFNMGYASAIGIVLFLLVLIISLVQRAFLDRESNR